MIIMKINKKKLCQLMLKLRAGCYESWFRSFGKGFDNVQQFTYNGRGTRTWIATDSDFGDLNL